MTLTLHKADSSALREQDCRGLINRILATDAFSRSERLSSFLRYICELTFDGRAAEINEQRIGEEVFGRSPGYDSMIDGIVRTHATRLRRRLDCYFQTEGAGEALRVSVPKGGYVPVFEEHMPAAIPPPAPVELSIPEPAPPLPVPAPEPRRRRILPAALWTATVVAMVAAGVWFLRGRFIPRAHPAAVHPFWGQMFNSRQPTLVVPGDSSLVIWEGLLNRNVNLDSYLSGDYRNASTREDNSWQELADRLAGRRYTSIVDLEIAQGLQRMALTDGGKMYILYPRDVRPNDLKSGNAVLIGDTEANPWVSLFEQDMNFVFSYDRTKHLASVVNRKPRGSEAQQWNSVASDPRHHIYAVVAYLPNLGASGNVLILEGTTMAGTECAWDFVSDQSELTPFLQRIRRRDGTIPHFELVLGSTNEDGSSGRASILASRIDVAGHGDWQ